MDTKFNFYDIVSYLIPGAIVLGLFYWLYVDFFVVSSKIITGLPDTVSFLLFLATSYFVGHLVQAVGAKIEILQVQKRQTKKSSWRSEEYLRKDNERYSTEYKTNLKKAIEQTFLLQAYGDTIQEEEELLRRRGQEMFYLCRAIVRQENKETNSDTYHAICTLYRGLSVTVSFGVIVSLIIIIKQMILWLASYPFDTIQLLLGSIFTGLFFVSTTWLKSRWDQYTDYYVDSVYTNFYVWYQKKDNGQTQNTSPSESSK